MVRLDLKHFLVSWYHVQWVENIQKSSMYIRGCQKFGIKVYWRPQFLEYFKDLKFKISEGWDQNWSCPESAQLAVSAKLRQPTGQSQDNFNFGPSLLKF